MSHSHSSRPVSIRVVTPEPAAAPADDWPLLPVMVPLLHPEEAITPRQEALITMLAQRARQGDGAANQLLWRAFEARLEPVVSSCAHATRQGAWPQRDGRPWVREDLRQEAFLVFSDLTATWEGTESYVSYLTAHFAWRLRMAARRLGPQRQPALHAVVPDLPAVCRVLHDAEYRALLEAITARLSPADAVVLDLRVREGRGLGDIAHQLGVQQRTITRRWQRICRVAHEVLSPPEPTA
jgi:DNA-directed RNA polymerase specialized sigma24 family protein